VRLVGAGGTIARQNVGTLTVFPGATVVSERKWRASERQCVYMCICSLFQAPGR
jgi:hypothetical protein